jgi:hypothetical protein
VLFQLGQGLAGRLWRNPLRLGGFAQAAQFSGFGKGGNGAQFVDGHAELHRDFINFKLLLVQVSGA